ncbi:hypothetical protein FS837_000358 [Tulasnella sp. UAMH 9824]|nr:hypothetical protein FS837_000358 [Tulasnella sp. UAMH 9824]
MRGGGTSQEPAFVPLANRDSTTTPLSTSKSHMISGSNNAPPPAYETEGVLPDGLYVLTNIMSRTVLDLRWGGLMGKALQLAHHTSSDSTSFITTGSSSAGTRCAGYSRNTNERIDHQLWIVKHDSSNDTYTLRNFRGGTYLDLEAGNTYNGTYATCSAWVGDGDHLLWALERVSRTTGEIKAILASWKSGLLDRLFQPYGDDAQYFVLPYELRKSIWERTNLQRQTVRKHVFDYDNFVIKAKDAVISWGRDRLLVDVSLKFILLKPRVLFTYRLAQEYSILFGVVYGNARTGPKAYNWYLSSGMHDLMFFDPQTGQEFTSAALDAIRFEPTFATL